MSTQSEQRQGQSLITTNGIDANETLEQTLLRHSCAQSDRLRRIEQKLDKLLRHDRRHIKWAMDDMATRMSADFAVRVMPNAIQFDHPHATLQWAAEQVPSHYDGMVLEFGVAEGTTLRIIADELGFVYGFDSFDGLPEAWRSNYPKGTFACEPPEVDGAEIIVGLFQESLPSFLAKHADKVAFLHIDSDLYSSAAYVLDALTDRMQVGTIIVFDEFFNYPGWEQGEAQAFGEWTDRTKVKVEPLAYTYNHEQVVWRVTELP